MFLSSIELLCADPEGLTRTFRGYLSRWRLLFERRVLFPRLKDKLPQPIMMKHFLVLTALASFPLSLFSIVDVPQVSQTEAAPPPTAFEEAEPEARTPENLSVEELRTLLDKDPAQRDLWVQLSERYRLADDRANFIEALDSLRKHFPEDAQARSVYGDAWIQLGDWQRLEPLLEEASITVEDPLAGLRSGIAKAREGRLFESLVQLQAAHRADPEQPQVLLNLASFYCRFQRCGEGVILFRKLAELRPDDLIAHLALAKAAKTENLVDEGIAAVHRAEELLQQSPQPNPRLDQELNDLLLHFINLQAEGEKPEVEGDAKEVEKAATPES